MTRTEALGILGLLSTATPDDIKKAYWKLAKRTHPDKDNSPGAEQRFNLVRTAFEVLFDPQAQRERAARDAREQAERERKAREERERAARAERERKERLERKQCGRRKQNENVRRELYGSVWRRSITNAA